MKTKSIVKICVVTAIVLFCLSALYSAVYQVSPGHRGVMVTLGTVNKGSIPNGIGLKYPFITKVIEMNIQTRDISAKTEAFTKDVQNAELEYTLTYELNPENVHVLYENVGTNYERTKIVPVLEDVLKDVIGKWQAQNLVSNRDSARVQILSALNKRVDPRYFQNLTFQIRDLDYSDNFRKSIEAKVIAEQKAQEAINTTVRIKEEAQQKVISAKAEAMSIKSEALAKNKGLTEYEAVQKWDGKLPQMMLGNSVPFININGLSSNK